MATWARMFFETCPATDNPYVISCPLPGNGQLLTCPVQIWQPVQIGHDTASTATVGRPLGGPTGARRGPRGRAPPDPQGPGAPPRKPRPKLRPWTLPICISFIRIVLNMAVMFFLALIKNAFIVYLVGLSFNVCQCQVYIFLFNTTCSFRFISSRIRKNNDCTKVHIDVPIFFVIDTQYS